MSEPVVTKNGTDDYVVDIQLPLCKMSLRFD